MKNCPFCGEEIQDVAKKCRHCGEWLNLISCPICGESISANSTECPLCHEDITAVEEVEIKKGEKKEKAVEVNQKFSALNKTEKKRGGLKKIRDDYAAVIIIVVIILGYSFFQGDKKKNLNDNIINSTYSGDNNTNGNNVLSESNVIYKVDEGSINYKNTNNEFNSNYELTLTGTDGGYMLENDFYSCFIEDKNISKFVDSVNSKGIVEYCKPITNGGNNKGQSSLAFFVDNSYATNDAGKIDTTGPSKRIKGIQKILNSYNGNNVTVYLGFIYMTKKSEDLAEVVDDRVIKLTTDTSLNSTSIKAYSDKKSPIEYFDKKHKIVYYNLSFVLDYQTCNKVDDDTYSCYGIDSLSNQIQQIYDNEFDSKENHSGNPLLEYFSSQKIQSLFNEIEKIYILTDGQFEITDSYQALKNEGNKMANFPEYKISNFYIDSYSKNRVQFEKFWNNNVMKSGLGKIDCEGIYIDFVGLAGGNPGFTNFAHDYFSNKMFSGCDVSFSSL